jgi:hypothetical protein
MLGLQRKLIILVVFQLVVPMQSLTVIRMKWGERNAEDAAAEEIQHGRVSGGPG